MTILEYKVGDIVRLKEPDDEFLDIEYWKLGKGKYLYKIAGERGEYVYLKPLITKKEAKELKEYIERRISKALEGIYEDIPPFVDIEVKVKVEPKLKVHVADFIADFVKVEKK